MTLRITRRQIETHTTLRLVWVGLGWFGFAWVGQMDSRASRETRPSKLWCRQKWQSSRRTRRLKSTTTPNKQTHRHTRARAFWCHERATRKLGLFLGGREFRACTRTRRKMDQLASRVALDARESFRFGWRRKWDQYPPMSRKWQPLEWSYAHSTLVDTQIDG